MEEYEFSRTELLIGREGIECLARKKVAIFGLGGVGSYVAEALGRAGIGSICLVDSDVVTITNINRQIHALHSTLGRPKVEVMAERLQDINPCLKVFFRQERYTKEKKDVFFANLDYVVDAIDDLPAKVNLIKNCLELKIPVISSMGTGNRLEPKAFTIGDISETKNDPLARRLRYELNKCGIKSGVKVVYSLLPPLPVKKEEGSTSMVGSISFVPPVAGLLLAGEVVNDLLKMKDD